MGNVFANCLLDEHEDLGQKIVFVLNYLDVDIRGSQRSETK